MSGITLDPDRRWECSSCQALTVIELEQCWSCGRPRDPEAEGVSIAEVDNITMQTAGMAAIAHLLRNPVYGVGMLEDIARIVEDCGYDLTNVNGRRTWEQH